jgi:hypothetical protein
VTPSGNGKVRIALPEGLEIRSLYELAGASSVQIRRLTHKRDSLEDIFLKAMNGAGAFAEHVGPATGPAKTPAPLTGAEMETHNGRL